MMWSPLLCDVRDLLGSQLLKKQSSDRSCKIYSDGRRRRLNSIGPTKCCARWVIRFGMRATWPATQTVELACHSAYAFEQHGSGRMSVLRQSFGPDVLTQKQFFLNSPQKTPMAQTWKTKVDILTHVPRTWAQIDGASLSALQTNSDTQM